MAKAEVKIVCECCGQEFTKTATKGNRADANAWEEWAKANITLCPKCYKKSQEIKDLPEITEGSEKQIAWATSIRSDLVKEVRRLIEAYELDDNYTDAWNKFFTAFVSRPDAKYWIDHRRDTAYDVIAEFGKILG